MQLSAGSNQPSYCGATWYSINMSIDELMMLQFPRLNDTLGVDLLAWAWGKIQARYGPLSQDFHGEIRYLYDLVITFYNLKEYEKGRTEGPFQ